MKKDFIALYDRFPSEVRDLYGGALFHLQDLIDRWRDQAILNEGSVDMVIVRPFMEAVESAIWSTAQELERRGVKVSPAFLRSLQDKVGQLQEQTRKVEAASEDQGLYTRFESAIVTLLAAQSFQKESCSTATSNLAN